MDVVCYLVIKVRTHFAREQKLGACTRKAAKEAKYVSFESTEKKRSGFEADEKQRSER